MKFDSPSRFTSFYESFSDLIFATMAIFVLLMIIFLALINPTEGINELKEQVKQTSEEIAKLQQSIKKTELEKNAATSQIESMVKKIAGQEENIKSSSLELIIAVDISHSMTEALDKLKIAIGAILKVLPSAATEFRFAVVTYSRTDNNPNGLTIFPDNSATTKKVLPKHKDNGSSFLSANEFIDNLVITPGAAPVEAAINQALKLSSSTKEFNGFQTIMLLGDIGPYESPDGQSFFLDRAAEQRIYKEISTWATRSKKRNFISVYSDTPEHNPAPAEFVESSKLFFHRVAESGGGKENFTNKSSDMLVFLLTSIFKEN